METNSFTRQQNKEPEPVGGHISVEARPRSYQATPTGSNPDVQAGKTTHLQNPATNTTTGNKLKSQSRTPPP